MISYNDKYALPLPEQVSWFTITISSILWTTLYKLVRDSCSDKSPEWCNRIVTLIHGLLISITGLQYCVDESEWVFSYPEEDTTPKQQLILLTSLGFFSYNLLWCLVHEKDTKLILCHHIYTCVALYRILVSQVNGATACCGLGIMEFTNPLQQWRWFLRAEGYNHSPVFLVIEIMFILLFSVLRIIVGTYICVYGIGFYPYNWEFKIIMTILYILSWFFFVKIMSFAYIKYLLKFNS